MYLRKASTALVLSLTACSDHAYECAGGLEISLSFPDGPPDSALVVWQDTVVINDCPGPPPSSICSALLERSETEGGSSDGGIDLGDCFDPEGLYNGFGATKQTTELVLTDGGLGYSAPPSFSLQVWNLGNCAEQPLLVASVSDYELTPDESPQGCSSATATLEASVWESSCAQCLESGGTWQPEVEECTSDCEVQNISCFTDTCPDP